MSEADPLVEIVTSTERFAEIAKAWTALWARADGSVFQSHPWIAAWWSTRSPGEASTLRIALAWDGAELVGVMALAVRRFRGVRVLEWAAKDCTDYCDALLDPSHPGADLVAAMWTELRQDGGWDVSYLSHLAPEAACHALSAVDPAIGAGRRRETSLRVRTTAPSGKAWFEALSKKPRQNYRRGWEALEKLGRKAAFRAVGPDEPLDGLLDRLVALKRDWLARTGRDSAILDRDGAAFRALVSVLARAGTLRLFVIEAEGELLAGSVNFVERGRLMAFFSAYDPAYERASLGMLLMVDYLRWAFDHRLGEVDFLCGDEDYKRRYANAEVTLSSVVAPRTLIGRTALAADRLAETWRRWREARPVSSTVAAPAT